MNKLLLSFAVASALGLAGCSGESLDELKDDTQTGGEVQIPLSRVVYDPSAGQLSPPNDLLLQGTTDGTLFMPGEKNAAGAHIDAPNYADPSTALGALDGWSTQNPFTIALSFAAGVTLDAASVQQPGSVYLVETLMGDPASPDADCRAVPRGAACKAVDTLTFGVDYVTRASGNSVAVIPLKPLKAATTYILVFTNNLKDSEGRSIAPSVSYELVKQDIATKPLGSAAQLALQGVINSFENAVAAESINKEGIIYTAAITTQSTTQVLATVKGLMGQALSQGQIRLTVENSNETAEQALVRAGLKAAFDPASPLNLASVYSGSITLPYYLSVPTNGNQAAPLNSRWKARCDSGAIIATLTAEKKDEYAAAIANDPVRSLNDAFCNTISGGALRDFGIDKQRHLTKFNFIPAATSNQAIDVQMTVPNVAFAAMIGLTLTKPDAGWPVVILQHGITSQKESMLAITAALSARGFATVAIDHPLHGSRGFEVSLPNAQGDLVDTEINATTNSATDYMNLSNLLVTRDNLRQSIADMLGVRLGLNDPTLAGLINARDVQFLGHSLGAISGTAMVALANSPSGSATLDAAYELRSAALAMPGGAIANFLLDSAAFGPTIKASVLLGAGGATAKAYLDFAGADSCSANQPLPYAACFNRFAQALAASNPAGFAAMNASFSSFAFAAQTVTDAGDPNNYASMLVASETPTYLIEVAGNGSTQLPDQVIPNRTAMPLAGTEPLAALLGASAVNNVAGTYPVTGTSLSRFNTGGHSSILSPSEGAAVMTEMQTQTANFFLSRGAAVVVTNGDVMVPAN